ncbi:tetratricopeptide repeat protein [Desertibacillus haloalkaliphilus]|uniref:tetratricopeptide repeat protein n=1 Tax=Desertibacillus haloalkaliphilus TaxID=1328930 RepID=UPI001C276E2C|nr:tetratricopeptide repeat protein [Desertibacillus haloalkaliphilus]MBU8907279.1 tetratricopeptide repeat protein [Desertibacillus haloalkaliphilus]
MENWWQEWEEQYQKVKQQWLFQPEDETTKQLHQLEEIKELTLQAWMTMEDQYTDLQEELEDQSRSGYTYESKGTSYFKLDMFDKAIKEFEQEKQQQGHSQAIVLLYLGFAYLYEQNHKRATELFLYLTHEKRTKLETHFAYVGLGCVYGQQQELDKATHFFEKALSLTSNPDVVYNLGMCHLMLNQPKLALPYFQQVVELLVDDPESYYFLGRCYLLIGQDEMAFQSWITALQLVESRSLLQSLAQDFEWHGFYEAAVHCYRRLLSLGHSDIMVWHGLAWNYGLLDYRQESNQLFYQLLSNDPNNENVWISYLWLLKSWGHDQQFQFIRKQSERYEVSHPLITHL